MGQYDPHGSGLLKEGGLRRFRIRRRAILGRLLTYVPEVPMSDLARVREEVPDFDPDLEFAYSQRELLLLTEKILLEDPKPATESPAWLNLDRLKDRQKREIYCANGTPDPSFVSGLYWRTHPDGRKWRTPEQRRANAKSFYR